jgi:hypothetical protein
MKTEMQNGNVYEKPLWLFYKLIAVYKGQFQNNNTEQKYSESKYIACGFYSLFCVIVIVCKTFVGCYTIRGIYFYRLFTHWRAAQSKSLFFYGVFYNCSSLCYYNSQSIRTNCFHAICTGPGLSRFRTSVLYHIPFVICIFVLSSGIVAAAVFILFSEVKRLYRKPSHCSGVTL